MDRFVLSDAQWAKMEPLCLGRPGDPGRSGKDNRLFVEAVLWIARTGSPWRDLPSAFGHWNSVYTRFGDWVRADTWKRLFEAASDEPDTSVNSFVGSRREDLTLHPTVKPTVLVADSLQDVTKRGDLVLDIFLGSGTTLVAAERSGRRFRGVDIDPAYVDVAIERWEMITGQEARKASADGQ